MKKLLLLCCLLTPTLAAAQIAPPPAGTAPPSFQGGGHGEHFEEAKARATGRLQEMLACVQAAQDMEALRACRPRHEGGPGGGEGGPPPGAPNAWGHPPATP